MKKQSGNILIFLLVGILILAGVAGGAYYLGTKKSSAPTLIPTPIATSQTPQLTPVSTLSPTSDTNPVPSGTGETANWKTCTNKQYGFTINYPSDYSIDEPSCSYNPPFESVVGTADDLKKNYVLTIVVHKTQLSIEEWVKSANICPTLGSCSEWLPSTIENSVQFTTLNRHYSSIETIFKTKDMLYNFSLGARNPNSPISSYAKTTYEKILSTFKFQ